MGVADHMHIKVEEYETRIRTFVPNYEEMISVAAQALGLLKLSTLTIVDLGTGTGELAARCLSVCPDSRLVGIDADPEMLAIARARLTGRTDIDLRQGDFLNVPLPRCDAIVASIALHHVKNSGKKMSLYERIHGALHSPGLLVSADCFPARDTIIAEVQREAWLTHLQRAYSRSEAEEHLASWSNEDTYFPLEDEMNWMREAGLVPEVLWRINGFAVVAARRQG